MFRTGSGYQSHLNRPAYGVLAPNWDSPQAKGLQSLCVAYNGRMYEVTSRRKVITHAGALAVDATEFGVTPRVTVDTSTIKLTDGFTALNRVTFTAWFRRVANLDAFDGIVFFRNNAAVGMHVSGTGSNQLAYHWEPSAAEWNADTGLDMGLNEWVFLALSVHPDGVILARGGTNPPRWNVYTQSASKATKSPTTPCGLCADPVIPARWSDASIAECRIYHRTLQQSELYALWAPATRWSLYAPQQRVWPVESVAAAVLPPQGIKVNVTVSDASRW